MSLLERLHHATHGGPRISRSTSSTLTLQEAYETQKNLIGLESKRGNPLKGYKISLTSQETQGLFDAKAPLYGALTEDSLVLDGELMLDQLSEPLVEVELMFFVDDKITIDDDETAILQKTRIAPGIEIPDSRYEDWFPHLTLGQIVADRAVAGKVVVGQPKSGLTLDQLNSIKATVTLDSEVIATGYSSDVLGNPVHAIKWLVQELNRSGQQLMPGLVISSGTFIMPKKLQRGLYSAQFDQVGEVQLRVK
ncbi:2-keto-4-pentenoate hydratase [Piscibacillus halophilus]|uniref:2-oxo-hept-3-ene-1,7-dioate hydratase n=1 Tax=Piscibacillus halophilus TaxID=571933 RepID=A0A1H9GQ12_9BACI|nr:hypothetical protein [Piscibacillus halophilus]SEQ52227.1 2-oxo-hept-3-ene-1,7-dioate hydratase [Piscibacillus halophilus]